MICDREDEIAAFIPEEYWNLEAGLKAPGARKPDGQILRRPERKEGDSEPSGNGGDLERSGGKEVRGGAR